MGEFKKGDIVGRKSYGGDVLFKVVDVVWRNDTKVALLKGLDLRLLADAPVDDLVHPSKSKIQQMRNTLAKCRDECLRRVQRGHAHTRERLGINGDDNNDFFERPGRVLHLDGDDEYRRECLKVYRSLGLDCRAEHVAEKEQPDAVCDLISEFNPDVLVLTGHDGLKKGATNFFDVNSYYNSAHFIAAVKNARRKERGLDDLVIIAGACQSHYEGLLDAGANFASSPHRILIHCLDPVLIAEKICFTPIGESLGLVEAITYTISGSQGIGGIETRGKFRLGLPKSPY